MTLIQHKIKRNVILGVFLGIPIALLTINTGIHLLDTADDMAVLAGYLLLAFVAVAAVFAIFRTYNIMKLAGLLGIVLMMSSCYKMVEPGHVGLLVKQTGSDRGVQDYAIQTGRVFYNPINESVMTWPTNVQRVIWSASTLEGHPANEEIAFQSKEGLHFTADVNAAYQMQRERVPHFYVQFRTEDITGFTHGFFRDSVRNAFNLSTSYTAEEINGSGQTELINRVQEAVKAKMQPYGVDVIQIGFAAPPRPPQQVQDAIHNKIAAIQKSEQTEFELRASTAEGMKVKAMADAMSEANRVTNASLTPALIEWEKIKKWDGRNSQVITGGSSSMLVNIK